MRSFKTVLLAAAFLLCFVNAAFATTYISVSARDAGEEHSVRKVWDDSGITNIGVIGDTEFTIQVTESSPYEIETCWIYINGTTYTTTQLNFTVEDYREHYGCVVIKYDDDSYESLEFHVPPAWDLEASLTLGAQAPAATLPSDPTAAQLISAVAANDPYGPLWEYEYYCICDGNLCSLMIATAHECYCGECDSSMC